MYQPIIALQLFNPVVIISGSVARHTKDPDYILLSTGSPPVPVRKRLPSPLPRRHFHCTHTRTHTRIDSTASCGVLDVGMNSRGVIGAHVRCCFCFESSFTSHDTKEFEAELVINPEVLKTIEEGDLMSLYSTPEHQHRGSPEVPRERRLVLKVYLHSTKYKSTI